MLGDMMNQNVKVGGVFHYEHVRKGAVIDAWPGPNIVVDQGLDYVLGAAFDGVTPQLAAWYIALFAGNYTPLNTDTAANIAGNSTESVAEYSEATRQPWVHGGVSSATIGNDASAAIFTFTADVDIYGSFIISNSTKGGTLGSLAAASRFDSLREMKISDELRVKYILTAEST